MRRVDRTVRRQFTRCLPLVASALLATIGGGIADPLPETTALASGARELVQPGAPANAARLTLDSFRTENPPCFDRSAQSHTAVVDTHVHFRPFGGPAVPFEEILGYFEATGVLFANVYGIGQMLPASSSCTYYLDCPGTPVTPTLKNDFVNAANAVTKTPESLHLTLAMTFPDLADPDSILAGMELLDAEYPGLFRWMGEVNLVKQALYGNGHEPVPAATIGEWDGFMRVLRERGIPLAIHSDLGSDEEPTRYLPLMEAVLRRYPDNAIVWVHMGLSRELTTMAPPSPRRPDDVDAGAPSEPDAGHLVAGDRRCLLLDAGGTRSLRAVPERVLGTGPPGHGLPGVARQGPGRLSGGAGGHGQHPSASGRRRLPEHRPGRSYFRLLGLEYQAPPICSE